ncbi:MAG TPA: hypothetical protein PLD25_24820 [Chloroflexota bacterium]|nr:hypothetical protein [Chloroflexota bacterium]
MIESPHFHDEEQIARLVRGTVQAAGQVDNGRLRQLMPAIPTRRTRPVWQRQLATACAALLVCLGMFGLYQSNQPGAGGSPTYVAITATFTSEPTATETQTVTSTAVAQPSLTATPAPPTPVAALPVAVIRNP